MVSGAPLDFLAVGHVTADRLPDGRLVPGGAAAYAAVTAAALGLRAGIVTRADPGFVGPGLWPGIAVHVVPADRTTTFENRYDARHRRHQRLLDLAPPLAPADIPAAWRRVTVVHFGMVAHEVGPELMTAVRADLVGLCPQGWLRHLTVGGGVHRGPWLAPAGLLEPADAVVLSEEDLEGEPRGAAWFAARTRLLVTTHGLAGAWAEQAGRRWHQPALPATAVDPTGAGDTFAAAFFIRLAETGDIARALRFAAAVAAFKVEHPGLGGLPGRSAILSRAGEGA